jgi:chitinase
MSGAGRRRRIWRLVAGWSVVALVAGGAVGVGSLLVERSPAAASTPARTWFAPYVDVAAAPTYQFQDPFADPAEQVVLSYVVASPALTCQPSWGGRYGLDAAESAFGLDRRLLAYEAMGREVIVAFGGPAGADLALGCTSVTALEGAYLEVARRYHASAIEVDRSDATLGDAGALERCAAALAGLEHSDGDLGVWLGLPAAPSGLDAADEAALRAMLAAHLHLAGINVLATDFGNGSDPPVSMLGATEQAVESAAVQLAGLYQRAHAATTKARLWGELGVTVSIGQDDLAGEAFTAVDAEDLAAFARFHHMARLSMLTLNRDSQCRAVPRPPDGRAGSCSGVPQGYLEFDTIYAGLRGPSLASPSPPVAFPEPSADNPATSPFPLWNPAEMYQAGYLVVWLGSVYQAKWYSKGAMPGVITARSWQAAWELIGPVLPSDHAPTITTLPAGTYPAWSPATVYRTGARVLYQGLPYQARFWTKGSAPVAEPIDPFTVPWQPLFTIPGEP